MIPIRGPSEYLPGKNRDATIRHAGREFPVGGRRIRCGNTTLLSVLLVLPGCSSIPSQPSEQVLDGRAASDPTIAQAWDTFVQRYDAAVRYFSRYGAWGNPATREQDEKVEAELSEALAGLAAVTQSGRLSQAELSLVQEEVTDIDRLGGRRFRNVRGGDGSVTHTDYFPRWPGMRAYRQLRMRVPLLRKVSTQDNHNRAVLQWVLRKVRHRVDLLAKPRVRSHVDALNRIGPNWEMKSRPDVTAEELRQELLSLILELEGIGGLEPTR